jgi:hypothetical protein
VADLEDIDHYARVAAALTGLTIEEAWWPGVRRHLGILFEHAAALDAFALDGGETPAPVFHP